MTEAAETCDQAAKGTHVVTDLAAARILADPFKLRILQSFVSQPRTTKQVAELMGEKAPRLYRHVEALYAAGLLLPKGEKQKRGTVERYLQAVAARFEVDSQLFAPEAEEPDEARELVRSLIRNTEHEVMAGIDSFDWQEGADDDACQLAPLIMKLKIQASEQQLQALRQQLVDWVEACSELPDDGTEDQPEFNCMIAFYPLDESAGEDSASAS